MHAKMMIMVMMMMLRAVDFGAKEKVGSSASQISTTYMGIHCKDAGILPFVLMYLSFNLFHK